jgi:hypothetical protein
MCHTDTNISLKSICKGPQYILRATISDIHDDVANTLKLIQPVTDRIATDELITATGLNPYFPGLGVRDLRFVPFVEGGAEDRAEDRAGAGGGAEDEDEYGAGGRGREHEDRSRD